jgi:hypothetical protein
LKDFNLIKELKGGSFSSTKVIEFSDSEKRVRKFVASYENREYGLVRWQSQVRRMQHLHTILPDNTPPILKMGVSGKNFFYDIPYYESSQNLFEYLSEYGEPEADTLFDEIKNIINTYSKITYGKVIGSFSVFFSEEVIARLKNIDAELEITCSKGTITKEELLYAQRQITRVTPIFEKIMFETDSMAIVESLTHGNLTLENALYNHDTNSIILIDPYSETYAESVLGDFSQLMQSSVSLYEEIVSGGDSGVTDFFEVNTNSKKTGVYYFGERLKRYIANLSLEDQKIFALFHAAQFVRMFPFKISKTPRLAIYFLLHGLKIIEDEYSSC